jgi:O-antigen ligase
MEGGSRIWWRGEVLALQRNEALLQQLSFIGILFCMAGMVTSPALVSLGIAVIILAGLALMPPREQLKRFMAHKPAVFISLLFALQLLSGLWTRETMQAAWLNEAKIKLPLFLAMYSLAVIGPFSLKKVRIAWFLLLTGTFLVGTGTVIDYIVHAAEINERIKVSKEVQVWLGCNHIYFSIVMAFSLLANAWSLSKPGRVLFKGDKYLIGAMVLLGFLEMHVLTTRTGLVGLYLTIMIVGWVMLLRRRRFLLALLLVLGLAALPIAGYFGLDSFKNRIDNTTMDVTEYFEGKDPNNLSIGTRLESWKAAYGLWKKHPLIGCGMADLKADMTDQYVEDKTGLCGENFQLPHNQFIQNLAGWGLLGLLVILVAWFYPVLSRQWPKDLIFWIFWLNYSFAMLGESTMERQVGVAFLVTCFMLSLGVGSLPKEEAVATT